MHTRLFGRLGWPVSEVGYGLWGMGGWSGSDDDEIDGAAIDRAITLGCTFFDTALAYGHGRSEELLGRVLARHRKKKLFVATKVPPKNLKWPGLASYAAADVFSCRPHPSGHRDELSPTSDSRPSICSSSTCGPDAWVHDDGWKHAVSDLKREGLIRGFSASASTRWEPTNVIAALRTGLVDSVQVVYNVFDQNPEDELFPICRELGVAVIARVPFDEGSLDRARCGTGRRPGRTATGATSTSRATSWTRPWRTLTHSSATCRPG